MAVAGAMGWTPAVFWAATPSELWPFLAGWRRANGLERYRPDAVSPHHMYAVATTAPTCVRSIRRLAEVRRGVPR